MTVASSSTNAPRAQGIFSRNQAVYAAHGVATFPVTKDKIPAIRGYSHVGLAGSAKLVRKFPNADALGFIAGRRSKITVLDVDTTDENVLADALARHGASNVIIRTGSGKWHAYYEHNGERRLIRPCHGLDIDIIGAGMAVAPPSTVAKGSYKIIQGHIDNLDRLLPAKGLKDVQQYLHKSNYSDIDSGLVHDGQRNETLWEHLMRNGRYCDDLNTMVDVGLTFNEKCMPPLSDDEVIKTARSAWEYEERGMNLFGGHGVVFSTELYTELLDGEQDGLILLGFLRANNRPAAHFMCTNTLAERLGWRVQRLAAARRRLIELGHLAEVKRAWRGSPALFEFPTIKRKP